MRSAVKKLEEEALRLPPRSRVRLVERLIASLEEGPEDPGAEREWAAEAQRRADELAERKVDGIPVEIVLARASTALR